MLPVFRCAPFVERLATRVENTLDSENYQYELIFVDDRGDDRDWSILQELSSSHKKLRAFRHRANSGQSASIATGVAKAQGEYVVVMDADLQDPPEEIPRFLQFAINGKYDIVLSVRNERKTSAFRSVASTLYRKLFPIYSRIPNGNYYGMFSVMSRKVVPQYLACVPQNRSSYIKVLDRLSKNIGLIYYAQEARIENESSYSLIKLLAVSVNGIGQEFFAKLLKTSLLLILLVVLGAANQYAANQSITAALALPLSLATVSAAFAFYALTLIKKVVPDSSVEIVETINASKSPFKQKSKV